MMSSSIPAPPKKLRDRGEAADDSENEDTSILPENESGSETGDASSNASDDTSSVVDSSDDDAAAAESSGDEADGDGDAGAATGVGGGGGEGESEDEDRPLKKTNKKRAAKKNTEDDMTSLGVPHGIHFEDDEDDDDEDEDEDADKDSSEYFQKLKSSVRESYIETYHPESLSHNYDEIQTLARVVRNSAGTIVDDLHRTSPIMTKYEKTRILGQRTKQLNEGAPAFIKIDSTVIDGYLIAVKELEQKKTPFIIRRPLPNGGSEYWRIQDLEIL